MSLKQEPCTSKYDTQTASRTE